VTSGQEAANLAGAGVSADSLFAEWKEAATSHYGPLMEGRSAPAEAGTLLLSPETGAGRQNVAPSLSPDGRYVAFLSERDLFTIELFLADATTGEILRPSPDPSGTPTATPSGSSIPRGDGPRTGNGSP
jgi:hypothetical protein